MVELKTEFKTEFKREREKRDLALYKEYKELMSQQGYAATQVQKHLMNKYKIHSVGTIYVIIKRVEKLLKNGN